MTHLDLFSGIGGFALAARWAGFKTVQFVEIDPFCQKVLKKNFPGVPIHDDIKTYSFATTRGLSKQGLRYEDEQSSEQTEGNGNIQGRKGDDTRHPTPFILTGGFPCQPYSCAGKRKGAEDDRALWPEMLRVISEARPTWVIGENVGGFVNMGLDDCISDLEAEGYGAQPFIIPACAKNAPHRRDRVWIVAHPRRLGQEKQKKQTTGGEQSDSHAPDTDRTGSGTPRSGIDRNRQKENEGWGELTQSESGGQDNDVANTKCMGWEKGAGNRIKYAEQVTEGQNAGNGSSKTPWDEPWLEVATRLCRVDDGVSRRMDGFISQDEAMRTMRGFYDSAALGERTIGLNFCKEKVLFKHLLWVLDRESKQRTIETDCPKAGATENKANEFLREVWMQGFSTETSQGSEHKEQLIRELGSALSKLPPLGTLKGRKLGSGCDEKKVRRGNKQNQDRVSRLKCLGNAIVPQIAYEIMKGIRDL